MKIRIYLHWGTFLVLLVLLTPLLLAARMVDAISTETMEGILFLISVVVGLFGPRPVDYFIVRMKLEGQWAVIFTWLFALLLGVGGLLLSKELFALEFVWNNALAIGGILFAAATFAFHRLKDQGRI